MSAIKLLALLRNVGPSTMNRGLLARSDVLCVSTGIMFPQPKNPMCPMMARRHFGDGKETFGKEPENLYDSNDIHENSDLHNISIPRYSPKETQEGEVRLRARLMWQSRKRGIAENCLLLSTFADKFLNDFDMQKLSMYDHIINQAVNDWQLYYWMTGAKPVPKEFDNEVMKMLQVHCRNDDMDERLVQPDLKYDPVEK